MLAILQRNSGKVNFDIMKKIIVARKVFDSYSNLYLHFQTSVILELQIFLSFLDQI